MYARGGAWVAKSASKEVTFAGKALNENGNTGGGIGHLSFQAIFLGELKNKRSKADTLNNSVNFQPFGNKIICHESMKDEPAISTF